MSTIGNGEGGLTSDVDINVPKSRGLVVRSKITLRNPLRSNSARAAKLASAGMVFTPYLISCVKPSQRIMVKGMMIMQYAIGYLQNSLTFKNIMAKDTYANIIKEVRRLLRTARSDSDSEFTR